MRPLGIFLFILLANNPAWSENIQYDCTLVVVSENSKAQGKVLANITTGESAGLTVGDYALQISKRSDIKNVDSIEMVISSVYGERNGSIVPIGTPWAMLVLNPRTTATTVVQTYCEIKSSSAL
jgi:hypothetical protein